MEITTKEVRDVTSVIDDIIEEYKEKSTPKKRDGRSYQSHFRQLLMWPLAD